MRKSEASSDNRCNEGEGGALSHLRAEEGKEEADTSRSEDVKNRAEYLGLQDLPKGDPRKAPRKTTHPGSVWPRGDWRGKVGAQVIDMEGLRS